MNPLINILIRTSFRPMAFAMCIASIERQTYKNIRVIVSYDNEEALTYIPDWCEKLPVTKSYEPFGYNLYCNDLKAEVREGWFFFLDDDDRLASDTILEELVSSITLYEHHIDAFIVQFIRGSVVKPISNTIIKGKIGMPCIVIDAGFRNYIDFDCCEDADFRFIETFASTFECLFLDIVLVRASRRGHGYTEQ